MCDTCGCNITSGNRAYAQGRRFRPVSGQGPGRHRHGHEVQGDSVHAHDHAHHGAPDDGSVSAVDVLNDLLAGNDHQAAHNRAHFDAHHVVAINLMSSPGSGKTALLEATAGALGAGLRVGVIVGDLETENDAERLRRQGIAAHQIVTGTACHLDAHLVHEALHTLDLDALDVLFIENVGNLVCPASFDLGQHHNVALLSVTEGDDKPAKYPVMFRAAELVLLTKCDLLPHLDDFDPGRAIEAVRALGNPAPVLEIGTRPAPRIDAWLDWVHARPGLRTAAASAAAVE